MADTTKDLFAHVGFQVGLLRLNAAAAKSSKTHRAKPAQNTWHEGAARIEKLAARVRRPAPQDKSDG